MIKIKLFCAAGMSTSVLVDKMIKAAKARNIEVSIVAYPESQATKHLEGTDVALLGPQVSYRLNKLKPLFNEKGIPLDVIPMLDYGMMNGEKVLDLALRLYNNR